MTSTAVTRAPSSAACTASRPLPVHRSSTVAPGAGAWARSAPASIQPSLRGAKTPGTQSRRILMRSPLVSTGKPAAAAALRERFDAAGPPRIGLEEELMLLDADTLDLTPGAAQLLSPSAATRASSWSCRPRR